MQIKKPTIYAIQALREYQSTQDILTTPDIARRLDISIAYATKVNRALVEGGFVEAIRGSMGGHRLAKDLRKIPIAELIGQIDGGLLDEEPGETKDMLDIRRKLRDTLAERGWGKPVASLL